MYRTPEMCRFPSMLRVSQIGRYTSEQLRNLGSHGMNVTCLLGEYHHADHAEEKQA